MGSCGFEEYSSYVRGTLGQDLVLGKISCESPTTIVARH